MSQNAAAQVPRELDEVWSDLRSRLSSLLGHAAATATAQLPVSAAGSEISLGQLLTHMIASHRRFQATGSDGSRLSCSAESIAADVEPAGSLADLCLWWGAESSLLDQTIGNAPTDAVIELICEDVMHEHDLRMALALPGARDSAAIRVALDALSIGFSNRVVAAGLTALRVTVEQWGTIAGAGSAYDCLVADRFEFVRGIAGRRSASEMRRWNWSGDPDRYIAVLSATGAPRATELRERDPRVPEHMRGQEFVL